VWAQHVLVKVTEGSFAAAHRCLHWREDSVGYDAGLLLLDEGLQQLCVISNMLAKARRVAVGQQTTTEV